MNIIHETISLCEQCYRHVPATTFEKEGSIWIGKSCITHGYSEHLVESDADFYLSYTYKFRPLETYCLDITNRCNLNCPHCYQMPDNNSKDSSFESIMSQITSYPDDGFNIALMGAEPTTRKDLSNIVQGINNWSANREIMVLTNGVNLSNEEYIKTFSNLENLFWTFGLNHPDYQGKTVRDKQIAGIQNCIKYNQSIKNISYTLKDLTQLEYCLDEMQQFGTKFCKNYRVRCGANIGRTPGDEKIFMSTLVKEVKKVCKQRNWSFEQEHEYGNRAHYSAFINGVPVKIIQWPDATTLDLEELQTESWADMLPGKPISPLVHQVMLRDGAVNKGLPLLDEVPIKYRRIHD